jgi:hypothetical protein
MSWFICVMSNWLGLVWILIQCISVELTPDWVIRFGETRLLVLWCVGGEYNLADSDKDRGRSRRLGMEDRGWSGISRVLSGRTIGRLGDAVCDPYRTHGGDKKRGFSDLASKQLWQFLGLGLKTKVGGLVIWASKSLWQFLGLASKSSGRRFVSLCLKTNEWMKTVWGHASSSSKIGRGIFGFGKKIFGNLFLVLTWPLCSSFIPFCSS